MRKAIDVDVKNLIQDADTVIFSVSGGKDSDAMTLKYLPIIRKQHPNVRCVAVHADLGRAEWSITGDYVREFCDDQELELHVVEHSKRDLLDGIRHRMATRPEVPPWPSAAARYCTSDWKRGPISKWIRNSTDGKVLVFMGLRAEESPNRAKHPVVSMREDCTAETKGRYVMDVLPIHDWTEAQVWHQIGHDIAWLKDLFQPGIRKMIENGNKDRANLIIKNHFKAHPAYAYGNHRLSCQFCVLADLNDLTNGAEQDPELYRDYCQIEVDSGFSFRKGFWLGGIRPDLLTDEQIQFYRSKEVI